MRLPPLALCAQAAVGSRPLHTEQGKTIKNTRPMQTFRVSTAKGHVSRVFHGFSLAAGEAAGYGRSRRD